jgi:hypothetical protein
VARAGQILREAGERPPDTPEAGLPPLAAVPPAHGDAWDHPDSDLVHRRRRARCFDAGEVEARPDHDPADRLSLPIRDQARRSPPPRQSRELGSSARRGLELHRASLLGVVAREDVQQVDPHLPAVTTFTSSTWAAVSGRIVSSAGAMDLVPFQFGGVREDDSAVC